MKKLIGSALLACLLFSMITNESDAYKCIEKTLEVEYEKSAAVFYGEALNVKKDYTAFKVKKIYKGKLKTKVKAYDASSYYLQKGMEEGKDYLVYLKEYNDRYEIDLCSSTREWDYGKEDIETLGIKPITLYDEHDFEKEDSKETLLTILIIIGVGMVSSFILYRKIKLK